MTRSILYICVFILYFCTSVSGRLRGICPPNEEFRFCTSPCGEPSCSKNGPLPTFCPPFNDEVCRSGCVCSDGFLRNIDGECIRDIDCPVCPPGEQFTDCIESDCRQQTCSDLTSTNGCQVIADDDDSCTSGCICQVGSLRDSNGVCIPKQNCPEFCPTNEMFMNCTQLVCRAQNCSQGDEDVTCGPVVEDDCVPGCVCISDTLRNKGGVCVTPDQCEGICQANEDFTECIETICRAQDCSQVGQDLACPTVELCDCTSGCVCSEGFVRDDDGDCIPDTQCPAQTCPPNEVENSCIQAICAPLNCSQLNKPIACAAIAEGSCISGCVCAPGFLRDDDTGVCVPEDSCFGLDCADNEVVDTCPGNCNDFCPTSNNESECQITAPDPDVCGPPVCRCGFNSKRDNSNGTCIPTRNCPPFDCSANPNEVYDPCPPLCSDNCSQVTPTGECRIIGFIGIVLECEPKCRCMTGFGRDNSGLCVPLDTCPEQPSSECSENEVLSTCIQTLCAGDNCSQLGQIIECPLVLNDECESGCVCIAGFLRNDSGNCIPEDQCPNNASGETPADCGDNEEFSNCTQTLCRGDTCSQLGGQINCPLEPVEPCQAGCVCIAGSLRDDSGNCVPEDQCPNNTNTCPSSEEFSSCTQTLCRNQNCEDIGKPVACPRSLFRGFQCQNGCVCIEGTLRNSNGNCVPANECPDSKCGDNEVFNTCANGCDNDFCPGSLDYQYPDECIAPAVCLQKCQCATNFKRNQIGVCILQQQCPASQCGINEIFNDCANGCDNDACPQNSDEDSSGVCVAPAVCLQQCQCAPGFKRDLTGVCIPQEQCPETQCGDNEVFNQCANTCDNDSCPTNSDSGITVDCIGAAVCLQRCECAPGFARDQNGVCISQDQCPGSQCGANEVFNQCGSPCNDDSCPTSSDATGIGPVECFGAAVCLQRCECAPGFARDQNGACIPQDQCPEQTCPANETLVQCSSFCNNDACPTSNDAEFSPFCIQVCGPPKCECNGGFRRADNGTCIPEEECPINQCGVNEQFNNCPSVCVNDSCPVNLDDDDDLVPCPRICGTPRCECIDTFKRDDSGNCIPEQNCPMICPTNEEFSSCPQELCRLQNCDQIGQNIACAADFSSCERGCVCVPGTLRTFNGSCIPEEQCPNQQCGENERFNQCPSVCNNDTCPINLNNDDDDIEAPCILICGPPRCECVDGFKRDGNGDCIPIGNCPDICPDNEEYSSCPQNICRPQQCPRQPLFGRPFLPSSSIDRSSCPDLPQEFCREGCVCKPGTLRNESGSCVPEEDCERPLQCPPDEIRSCVGECPPEKTCDNRDILFNCLQTNKRCQIKCVCKPGFVRNALGICISQDKCDLCGENEFFNCGQECDNVCADQSQNRTNCDIFNIVCNKKCYCLDGFARDASGKCVPMAECPKKENQCSDPNEEFKACKTLCPPDSCFSLVARFKCESDPPCVSGCNCKPGFLRVNATSPCVPLECCPELAGDC